ncbi:hypothetical protein [Kribbella sp. HUAS MG21]|uniref:Uncharacterized protein n=1 Tax=Kribbella sp. HUAS MG21 TaxID=3160966 RepID=A0AAU7TGB3_9ACTN
MRIRRLVAWSVAVAVLGSLAAAVPSVADGNHERVMRVSGAAGGVLGPEWGPYAGDPVRFAVDGTATDPVRPSGSFHVVHRKPDGRLLAEFRGRLTSLTAVDEVAVVTGVIEAAEHPGVPLELVGKPISLTVYDGGRQDRIGWMWGFFGAPVALQQGTAPDLALTEGDFAVNNNRHPAAAGDGSTAHAGSAVEVGRAVRAFVDDRAVRFELAARIPPGGDAKDVSGGFRFVDPASAAYVEGRIDCLAVGGPVAMATGVVTGSDDPGKVGKPVSFALKDGAVDRVGWLWSWSGGQSVVDCRSGVPFRAARPGGVIVRS